MGPHIGVNLVHLVRVDRFVSDGVTACPVADTRRVRLEDMRYVLVSENHSGPVTASLARRSLSRARRRKSSRASGAAAARTRRPRGPVPWPATPYLAARHRKPASLMRV